MEINTVWSPFLKVKLLKREKDMMFIENCTAINKEKTVSVPWDADGQNIMIRFQEKQRAGCQGCFLCHRGWI